MRRRIFPVADGIGENGGVAYAGMRWSWLKNNAAALFTIVAEHVFPDWQRADSVHGGDSVASS